MSQLGEEKGQAEVAASDDIPGMASGKVADMDDKDMDDKIPGVSMVDKNAVYIPVADDGKQPHPDYSFGYVDVLDRFKYLVLFVCFALTVGLVIYAIGLFAVVKSAGFTDPSSESEQTTYLFEHLYVSPAPDNFAILQLGGTPVETGIFSTEFSKFKNNLLTQIPQAFGLIDYFDYPKISGLISDDGTKAVVLFRGADSVALTDLQKLTTGTNLTANFAGNTITNNEIGTDLSSDLVRIEIGSAPVLIFLLLFVYGGLVAMVAPIILSLWTLVLTLSALHAVSISFSVTQYVRVSIHDDRPSLTCGR
jgi:hypothetical protein